MYDLLHNSGRLSQGIADSNLNVSGFETTPNGQSMVTKEEA